METDIGSHWDECWREHHECAVKEVERLSAGNEQLDTFNVYLKGLIADNAEQLNRLMDENKGAAQRIAELEATLNDAFDALGIAGVDKPLSLVDACRYVRQDRDIALDSVERFGNQYHRAIAETKQLKERIAELEAEKEARCNITKETES